MRLPAAIVVFVGVVVALVLPRARQQGGHAVARTLIRLGIGAACVAGTALGVRYGFLLAWQAGVHQRGLHFHDELSASEDPVASR
jgi:hypothetical protein